MDLKKRFHVSNNTLKIRLTKAAINGASVS